MVSTLEVRYFSLVTLVVGAAVYKDEDVCMYALLMFIDETSKRTARWLLAMSSIVSSS